VGGEEKAVETAAGRDIIWRSRAKKTPELVARIMAADDIPDEALPRYFRAFDFLTGPEKTPALEKLLAHFGQAARPPAIVEVIQKLPSFDYANSSDAVKDAVEQHLRARVGSPAYFEFVARFNIRGETDALVGLATEKYKEPAGGEAVKLLLKWGELDKIKNLATAASDLGPVVLGLLGATGQRPAIELLQKLATAPESTSEMRTASVEALARSRSGERELLDLAKAGKLPDTVKETAGRVLGNSTDQDIRNEATQVIAMAAVPPGLKLPPAAELAKQSGDAESGRLTFLTLCQTCHKLAGQGINLGPALDEIGTKLPKEQLITSILDPSQGISFGFEAWEVQTTDGATLVGLITSETDQQITLRAIGGIDNKIKKSDITSRKKLSISLMPPLAPAMNEKQIVDLVEFLAGLKKK
jgi:putative heme-binding domain-containing protein